MGSPFSPIPFDVILHKIVPHLDARALGRLMQVNRDYLSFFIRDECWAHIRDRCCDMVPFWREHVFDQLPWASSRSYKKRAKLGKTKGNRISLPRSGLWYTLRKFVAPCLHPYHFIKLLRGLVPRYASFMIDEHGNVMKKGDKRNMMAACVAAGILKGVGRRDTNYTGFVASIQAHDGILLQVRGFQDQYPQIQTLEIALPAAYCVGGAMYCYEVNAFHHMFWF